MPWEEGGGGEGVSDAHPPASVLSVTVALFIVYLAQPAILFMACALWLGIHCRANGGRFYYILLVCVRLSPCYLFIHFFIIRVVALVFFIHRVARWLIYASVFFFYYYLFFFAGSYAEFAWLCFILSMSLFCVTWDDVYNVYKCVVYRIPLCFDSHISFHWNLDMLPGVKEKKKQDEMCLRSAINYYIDTG